MNTDFSPSIMNYKFLTVLLMFFIASCLITGCEESNQNNPLIQQTTPEIEVNKRGNIIVEAESMRTTKKGVFAGGDIVTGGATVILAMGAGRTAAKAIDDYLTNGTEWVSNKIT